MSTRLPKLLAIDDDRLWLSQVPEILDGICEVTTCESIDEGILAIENDYYDIALLDLNFDGDTRTGYDLFKRIASTDRALDVIVISGETRPDRMIQIINAGVTKFLPKPVSPRQVRETIRETIHQRELKHQAIQMSQATSGGTALIGSSPVMQRLREEIQLAVRSGAKDILLCGETGTGKEVVARAIANLADPAKRMIPIHCGAISEGIAESELFGHVKGAFTGADRDRAGAFELAGGGYVFLDEIGEMPLAQQAKLLRVLQERKVQRVGSYEERPAHFRCISATNVDIASAVESKTFREDLYYRIAKLKIKLPTLRERRDDISELVLHFLNSKAHSGTVPSISDQALSLLAQYSWPGNVRQLQSAVEFICSRLERGQIIREQSVCEAIPELGRLYLSPGLRVTLGHQGAVLVSNERKRFQKALLDAKGDRTEAARLLGISRATFFRRAREFGIASSRPRSTSSLFC